MKDDWALRARHTPNFDLRLTSIPRDIASFLKKKKKKLKVFYWSGKDQKAIRKEQTSLI